MKTHQTITQFIGSFERDLDVRTRREAKYAMTVSLPSLPFSSLPFSFPPSLLAL